MQFIIIGLILLGLVFILFYFFEANAKYVIAIISGGLVIGLSTILIKAFLIPSQWIFNHRFGFEGSLFMISLLLLISAINDYGFSISSIMIDFIFGGVFGFFISGYFFRSNYNKKANTIAFDKLNVDHQLLNDLAFYKEGNSTIIGKLILTEQKLLFIPGDSDISTTEIELPDHKQSIRIRKSKFGIPNGIIINENLQLSLSYPRLWIKKINAA